MSICQKPHRYVNRFAMLPDDQKVASGRHRCVGCAYEKGYDDGAAHHAPNFMSDSFNESQAGEGRHKSPEVAYYMGYYDGLDWWFRNH